MTSNLLELADRCEKADAGDQHEILLAAYEVVFGHPAVHEYRQPDGERGTRFLRLTDYGAFLDAALTLKPNGLGLWLVWSSFDAERPIAEVVLTRSATTVLNDTGNAYHCAETELVRAKAATPALALCAAALRARASGPSDE